MSEPAHAARLILHSEADTDRLGRCLAAELPSSVVLGLIGTLGAGKTRLVRALAVAAGVDEEAVQSPTFVLCHEYYGRQTIFHLDAYRLNSEHEFLDLGVEDYWSQAAWTVIEWSDRVQGALPEGRIDLTLSIEPDASRLVTFDSPSPALSDTIQRIIAAYESSSR